MPVTLMTIRRDMEKNAVGRRCLRTYASRFADGKATTPYRQFMGYRRSKDGTPKVSDDFQLTQASRKSLPSENETEIARVRKKTTQ